MDRSIYAPTYSTSDRRYSTTIEIDQVRLCSFFMARVCCSIEMEPRTLSQVQLNHAREMAADVVQKTEPNEVSATFSEGLGEIDSKRLMEREEGEETQSKLILELEEAQVSQVFERPPCQCLCTAVIIETPDQEKIKEPLSAPF